MTLPDTSHFDMSKFTKKKDSGDTAVSSGPSTIAEFRAQRQREIDTLGQKPPDDFEFDMSKFTKKNPETMHNPKVSALKIAEGVEGGYIQSGSPELKQALQDLEPEKSTVGGALKETAGELGTLVKNIPGSAFQMGKDIAGAIVKPIQTAKSLAGLSLGVVQKLIPGEQESEQYADAMFDFMKERYGSLEKAKETLVNDPVGALSDISIALGVSGGGLKAAGAVTKSGKITKTADTLVNVSRTLEPVTNTGKAIKTTAGKALKSNNQATKLMSRAIDINPSDSRKISKMIKGKQPAEWLLERGIKGSTDAIIDQLENMSSASKTFVDDSLVNVSKRFKNKKALQALDVLENTLDGIPGLEDDLAKIKSLKKQNTFTLSELNETKRLIDDIQNVFKSTGDVKEGAKAKGLANIRRDIKEFIETKADDAGVDVKSANNQTQVAKELEIAIKKSQPRVQKRAELSLSDLGAGGVGAIVFSGNPLGGFLGTVVVKKVLNSPTFQTSFANRISKLPKKELIGIEKVINSGKALSDSQKLIILGAARGARQDYINTLRSGEITTQRSDNK